MSSDGIIFLIFVVVICCLVLPIIAIVRTGRIRDLERRIAALEASLARSLAPTTAPLPPPLPSLSAPVTAVPRLPPPLPHLAEPPEPFPLDQSPLKQFPPDRPERSRESFEVMIGRRWLALVAVALIVGSMAFFLKYAFENGWIGELGRVTLGITGGLAVVWLGHNRHKVGWRYLSQVLIGGGVTILYLSVYAAFAYYHLIGQRSAFVFLVILVAEAHLLSMTYNARLVAILGLTGGFLVPVLLSTGHDQYTVLFTYIILLDLAMLALVVAKSWRGLGSIAYFASQLLFWAWYTEHYTNEKRLAALLFQLIVLILFAVADLTPNLRRRMAQPEELIRLMVNPLVFYSTWYRLLNEDRHIWMATVAIALAILYTALARFQLNIMPSDRRVLFTLIAIALTFITIAIPVQLDSNWVVIGWSAEALALLWASSRNRDASLLRWFAAAGFALATGRFFFFDTPWDNRLPFTPIFNRYFLEALTVVVCLALAAELCRRFPNATGSPFASPVALGLVAFALLWWSSSFEAYTYFSSQAVAAYRGPATQTDYAEQARQLHWAGQLSLSILWSAFAGVLMAGGFRLHLHALRVAGLSLFGLTLAKVAFIDTAELREFYRILALLVLGLVLLTVAWAYQRIPRREDLS